MKCIIIEDEIPAQKIIQHYADKIPELEIVKICNSAIEANTYLQNNPVQLLFLDINLPDISGLDLVKMMKNPPAIIMTTAYPDYAVDSFELDTIVDYLVKPFSMERFLKAINKAHRFYKKETLLNDATTSIFLNVDKTLHKINICDICYILSEKNYVTVVTTSKKYSFLDSLKNWENKVPKKQFIRIHKSYIVNSACIDKIQGNLVVIKDTKIPIGRTYKDVLFNHLNLG